MKDIHCHILFGVDDGSCDIEESIKIIQKAKSNGYTDLILTPHYRTSQDFICNNEEKKKIFKSIVREVKKRNIDINLYLGNEVTLDGNIFEYLMNDKVLTLNNSRYILLELPFFSKLTNIHEIIFRLRTIGLVPIIAHPERYIYYSDLEEFSKMLKEGALFQGNIGSLYGKYGKQSQSILEEMLKRRMIHFMGSDIHYSKQTSYQRIDDVKEKIKLLTGSEKIASDLVSSNIEKVIENKQVETYTVRVPRRRLKIFSK